MSYILDALRKAAEQRGSTTSVLFRPAPVQSSVARSARTPWIVVGGLLVLNVAVLAWVFRPSSAPDVPPSTASESSASPAVALAPAPAVPSAPPVAVPGTAAAVAPAPSAAPTAAPVPRASDLVAPSNVPAVRPAPKTVAPPPSNRATASRAVPIEPRAIGSERSSVPPTAVPERPIVPPTAVPIIPPAVESPASPRTRAERRAGVIQAMPPQPPGPSPSVGGSATGKRGALKLEVLSYSDVPAQRLVFISGRKYVEGDTIEGGFRVEQIKEDSVVLSDQGQQFTLR
jgi:hypothetical protein